MSCVILVHAEAITSEELDRYKQALGRPGCLHAGLNYYRAAVDGLTWAAPAQPPCAPQADALQTHALHLPGCCGPRRTLQGACEPCPGVTAVASPATIYDDQQLFQRGEL